MMALRFIMRTNLKSVSSMLRLGTRHYCDIPDREKPVKFSTSEAAGWRAEFTRSGNVYEDDTPDAQTYIVCISTGIFLYYFLLYREESDIDLKFDLTRSIFDRVEGLEEVQLKLVRKSKIENGEDVTEIDKKLHILISERLSKESENKHPASN